jgi:hypothetical protein
VIRDTKDKVDFFFEMLTKPNVEVDASSKYGEKDTKKQHILTELRELSKPLNRAYFVLRSELVVDLNDEKKYNPRIVLHSVCQGTYKDNDMMKDYISRVVKAIKRDWRAKKTEQFNETKKKIGDNKARLAEEEDALFERAKMGWMFRDLYVDTDQRPAKGAGEQLSK